MRDVKLPYKGDFTGTNKFMDQKNREIFLDCLGGPNSNFCELFLLHEPFFPHELLKAQNFLISNEATAVAEEKVSCGGETEIYSVRSTDAWLLL